LGLVVVIATVGQGSRDVSVAVFPIIFVFAGLTLDRKLFAITVALALAASGWLVFGQTLGWYEPLPFSGPPGVTEFIILSLILLIAAFAVDVLATNMHRSIERARKEIEQHKKAEEEREKVILSLQKALGERAFG
jgi:hypothetical protein